MLFVTIVLVILLVAGVFLAARELTGFRPEPEWQDVGRLRDHLAEPLPIVPEPNQTGRASTWEYCRRLRREFESAWRLCRFLAPITGDPGYVGTLVVNKIRFHATLALAMVCAGMGCSKCCDRLLRKLRLMSESIRTSALMILTRSDIEHGFSPA